MGTSSSKLAVFYPIQSIKLRIYNNLYCFFYVFIHSFKLVTLTSKRTKQKNIMLDTDFILVINFVDSDIKRHLRQQGDRKP